MSELAQAKMMRSVLIGALAEDGDLSYAQEVMAEIKALVKAANEKEDGVGDVSLAIVALEVQIAHG